MAVERFLPSAIAHFEPADLIGALATGILVLDSDLCVVYANVAAQDLLAFTHRRVNRSFNSSTSYFPSRFPLKTFGPERGATPLAQSVHPRAANVNRARPKPPDEGDFGFLSKIEDPLYGGP